MGNNTLPIKVVCSSYDKYRRSYEDTSVKEIKTAIGAALVAGEYQLAVTLLFFCYTTLNHDSYSQFHGCGNMWSHPSDNSFDTIMADLYECSNSANIIRRNYQDNAPKWRYPDGLDVAIFSVQKAVVSQHYPEAIEADGNVRENMPIKIGDRLAVFIYDEYYKKTRATEVEILAYSNGERNESIKFNFFPQGTHAAEAYRTYDGEKDHWGIECHTHSYGDTEYTRMQVISTSSKSNTYCGFGYERGESNIPKNIVARFKDVNCNTMADVVTLLTPLYNNLKTVWTDIAPDYRDVWFLPQVVSHYGNKHLATMQELLSQVDNYSVKEKSSSGGGVGFWSD